MNSGNDEFTSPVFDMGTLMRAIVNPYGKRLIVDGVPAERLGLEGKLGLDGSKASKADSIKATIFVIAFIGVMIAMPIFAQTEPLLCMTTFGAVILIFGLINLFQNGVSLESIFNLVIPLIGAVLVVISVMNVYHKSHSDSFYFTQTMMAKIACVGFEIVGAGMMVISPVLHFRKMNECTQIITAKCIYRNYNKNANGRTAAHHHYELWWQYEVNGMIYVTSENTSTNKDVPIVGDLREIRFSPEKPWKIYRPIKSEWVDPIVEGAVIVGFIMVIMALLHW
ncbi:MAG: hypothetical protein K6F71_16710 [Ruminococcus sp.]|uniref:hypothetical protein n=1 Tax=Ruminococcus sp. TaxID=41978 RepID=UPI0025F2F915|nr:hypothetical protein [Ruminococcus sp.]MCR5542448.1 hypothetical protein [Ruminococcus sp.]